MRTCWRKVLSANQTSRADNSVHDVARAALLFFKEGSSYLTAEKPLEKVPWSVWCSDAS